MQFVNLINRIGLRLIFPSKLKKSWRAGQREETQMKKTWWPTSVDIVITTSMVWLMESSQPLNMISNLAKNTLWLCGRCGAQMGGPSDLCSGTGKCPQKPSPVATTTAIQSFTNSLWRVQSCEDPAMLNTMFFSDNSSSLSFSVSERLEMSKMSWSTTDEMKAYKCFKFFSIFNVRKIMFVSHLVAGFHDFCIWTLLLMLQRLMPQSFN